MEQRYILLYFSREKDAWAIYDQGDNLHTLTALRDTFRQNAWRTFILDTATGEIL